eukprot:4483689-Prymnesium_polylepis.1
MCVCPAPSLRRTGGADVALGHPLIPTPGKGGAVQSANCRFTSVTVCDGADCMKRKSRSTVCPAHNAESDRGAGDRHGRAGGRHLLCAIARVDESHSARTAGSGSGGVQHRSGLRWQGHLRARPTALQVQGVRWLGLL